LDALKALEKARKYISQFDNCCAEKRVEFVATEPLSSNGRSIIRLLGATPQYESNVQELQESLSQPMYANVTAEDCLNIDTEDETEAAGKEKIELPKNRLSTNLAHTMML
jgi:hypothetical protein